ncbi:AraC family ligand binding domain-containing protein [Alkalihalobacillus sp. 1P02AB]|uniref:AraC family ligand binding domain-containing protein n=1 Tax=Alkalihalobacillus sp. 1P02AB TaxID=3132260 RepID=UPI0039A508AC
MMLTKRELTQLKNTMFVYSEIHYKHYEPGSEMKRKYVSKHTLIYIISGKGRLTCNERTYVVEQGKVFLLAPGQIVEGVVDCTEPVRFYAIPFFYQCFGGGAPMQASFPFLDEGEVSIKDTSQILTLLKQIDENKETEDPLQEWRQRIRFQEVMYTIVSNRQRQKECGDTHIVIERIVKYINENYMKEISIKGLAEWFGLSPTNFAKIFKAYVGVKPSHYLTQIRMKRSKELLYSNQRLKVVAKSVGYNDDQLLL